MGDSDTNTYMFDPQSPAELARLINQDQMQTRAMGGPFAGLSTNEVDDFRNVLDLACGPGGWALDVAFPPIGSFIRLYGCGDMASPPMGRRAVMGSPLCCLGCFVRLVINR